MTSTGNAVTEIDAGQRFAFGENWSRFLELVDEGRIHAAQRSLEAKLGPLTGQTFLDVGCGSGLFSLAARRLGARVVSFDFDPASVACAAELRRRYCPDDDEWQVEQGSVLDATYLAGLGTFDVVYSWGVLHHTGDMWSAVANVAGLVAPGGQLFVAIYNDQGRSSRNWRRVKELYVRSGPAGKKVIEWAARAKLAHERWDISGAIYRTVRRLPRPRRDAGRARGMDARRDLIDWIGGFPFEVAKPEEIFDFYREQGFELTQLTTCGGGIGCNEFVFRRTANAQR